MPKFFEKVHRNFNDAVDSTPGLGQMKGIYHHTIERNDAAGAKSMWHSNRSTVVAGATATGTYYGGPAGGVAAGIAAKTAYDSTTR